jgi:hypothetical protein
LTYELRAGYLHRLGTDQAASCGLSRGMAAAEQLLLSALTVGEIKRGCMKFPESKKEVDFIA